jgi:hypothetical protein
VAAVVVVAEVVVEVVIVVVVVLEVEVIVVLEVVVEVIVVIVVVVVVAVAYLCLDAHGVPCLSIDQPNRTAPGKVSSEVESARQGERGGG